MLVDNASDPVSATLSALGKVEALAQPGRLAEGADDTRLDPAAAVHEHDRPEDIRAVASDEDTQGAVEKRCADRLDVGEVEPDSASVFEGFRDLVADDLRACPRAHVTAMIPHPDDLRRDTTQRRVPVGASLCGVSCGRPPASACV